MNDQTNNETIPNILPAIYQHNFTKKLEKVKQKIESIQQKRKYESYCTTSIV